MKVKIALTQETLDIGGRAAEQFVLTITDPSKTDIGWSSYDDPTEALAEAIEQARRHGVGITVDADTAEAVNMQTGAS